MSYTSSIVPNSVPDGRVTERVPAELQTIVQVKESNEESWKEVTQVTTVSRNGAGFSLSRPVKVGRLLTLVMPLAPELRAYDLDQKLYPVLGLVQYCNKGVIDGKEVYHVGTGFVGKAMPESFKADPTQNYRISGMGKDGLWLITEAALQYKDRKQPRHWISVGVSITLLQQAEKSTVKEETYTKNIAAGGASVVCSLAAAAGDKVKFACREINFYSMAVVRSRKAAGADKPTLHLQFIDNEFPVEKLLALYPTAKVDR